MQRASALMSFAIAAGLSACASGGAMNPATVQRVNLVETNIRAAQEAGAERDPRAARHLDLARKQLAEARQLREAGDHRSADKLQRQAALDAELALAEARETNARAQADAIRARINEGPRDAQEVTP